MRVALAILAVILGLPGAATALHLLILGLASLFYRESSDPAPRLRFLVLIPAQNEEAVIGATLDRVLEIVREDDLILVVPNGCTDDTSQKAREKAVEVFDYDGSEGVGKAAAMTAGLKLMSDRQWDAVVNIDADSLIEPGFFEALESKLAKGHVAVQPRSEHERGSNVISRMAETAFALQGITLPRGRNRLGLSTRLRGAGMTMTRDVALGVAFPTQGVSEDLFYGLQLLVSGHSIGHVDRAVLRSASAPSIAAGTRQKTRWETGRMAAARSFIGPLLRTGTPSSAEAALYLATPPIGIAVLSLALGTASSLLWGWTAAAIIFLTLLGAVGLVVAIGLIQSRASWKTWLALLAAPLYVIWKAIIQVKAIAGLGRADEAFDRTDRS